MYRLIVCAKSLTSLLFQYPSLNMKINRKRSRSLDCVKPGVFKGFGRYLQNEYGIDLKLIRTKAVWKGITYKEDLDDLKNYIKSEIKKGIYPEKLY